MTWCSGPVGVIGVCVALAPSLAREWRPIRRRVFRRCYGKPILDAPTRVTPEASRTVSGIWNLEDLAEGGGGRGPPQALRRAGAAGPPAFSQGPPVVAVLRVGGRGSAADSTWAAELKKKRMATTAKTTPTCGVADRLDAVPQPSAAATDGSDQEPDAHHLRVELRVALHLHRRASRAEQRPHTWGRLLTRLVGGRHAGRRDDELPR